MRETAWLGLGVLGLAVGVALVRRGWWPRRVGTVRRCAGCGYDLTGNESGRCSECGAELGEGRTTVGDRRRRPVVAVIGLCVLLVGVGLLGSPGIERLRRVDWYRYRPQGWVAGDLSSSDGALVQRAWEELERRRKERGLSEETEARVAEAALVEQAKAQAATGPLLEPMVQYLSDRCFAGKLAEGQRERFFRQAFRAELRVRPVVVTGERAWVHAVATGNGSEDPRWSYEVEFGDATIGKQAFQGRVGTGMKGLRQRGLLSSSVVVAGVGEQQVTFPMTWKIHRSSADGKEEGPVVMSFDSILRGTTTVERTASETNPKMVHDATLADAVRAATEVDIRAPEKGAKGYEIHVRFENPPIGVAFSVAVRVAGREFQGGGPEDGYEQIACAKGQSSWAIVTRGDGVDEKVKQLDVVLRASGMMARRTTDVFEMWDGELVFKDVPVPGTDRR